MSCVCVLTPVVIAAWPQFSAAVAAAAASLGYAVATERELRSGRLEQQRGASTVALTLANSELVTDRLGRDQRIRVTRDGVTVVFSRDERGRASVCVSGPGRSDEVLRALGEELSRGVVQQYAYQRILEEARVRGYAVVSEEVGEDRAIRLRVRHWEVGG